MSRCRNQNLNSTFRQVSNPVLSYSYRRKNFVKTELSKIPDKTGTVKILDPIFGDEVQAVRFKNVTVGD